ncbi:hypothetical protein M011DRAFT_301997 [Sporormia fimetaria CBS 119925]|uniref:Mif2/CENP-C cupin domain-containing protein n=1 Tax=Sporormia fimetaria CBS 119925 TaxID=1340428 RepID=A0A6A6UWS6_9PLEO|nr:hypothetical protein M011DRAFT_301997 [Sporormia fimetaria CBS 119925]
MPGVRKQARDNQYYNVGEQGRKTGITLEDRGVRDEYGMEPVSGIFSSPQKPATPQQRSGTLTQSESMDIQDSTIPDLTPGHRLRNARTSLPPPRSRSPMKTSLGATPRRSLGPRPSRRSESPLVRQPSPVDEDDTHTQETSALSGAGARRDLYDLSPSPNRQNETVDPSDLLLGRAEDSFAGGVAEDTFAGAVDTAYNEEDETIPQEESRVEEEEESHVEAEEESRVEEEEESRMEEEPTKQPAKRGRKRKSNGIDESLADNDSPSVRPKRTRTVKPVASASAKSKSAEATPPQKRRGRPPRAARKSDTMDEGSSALQDASIVEPSEETPAQEQPKRRGRKPKAAAPEPVEAPVEAEQSAPAKKRPGRPARAQQQEEAPADDTRFKKPMLPSKAKSKEKATPTKASTDRLKIPHGKLFNNLGNPISAESLRAESVSSSKASRRFGRSLSVYREIAPDQLPETSRGRHRIAPAKFWENERVEYDKHGNLKRIMESDVIEEEKRHVRRGAKGRKRAKPENDEPTEDELEDWEKKGTLAGEVFEYDPATETALGLAETTLAWAGNGMSAAPLPNLEFKFIRLGTTDGPTSYMSWGCLDFEKDEFKRRKNSRRMHMVFHVTKGAVTVHVHENEFVVHKGGVFTVPRGTYWFCFLMVGRVDLQAKCGAVVSLRTQSENHGNG